jgi:hypothetical protein
MQKVEQDNMNNARLKEAERSLTGVAVRVLEATPKTEAWPVGQITGELRRLGHNIGPDVVLGCLDTMLKSGIVREPKPRNFVRVNPKEKIELAVVATAAEPPKQADQVPAPKAAQQAPGPISAPSDRETLTKLADLSTKLRASAQYLLGFADSIDDVAIEVEERIQKINADSEKLAQLRALLKGIGA